jgi:hypothetical protein
MPRANLPYKIFFSPSIHLPFSEIKVAVLALVGRMMPSGCGVVFALAHEA